MKHDPKHDKSLSVDKDQSDTPKGAMADYFHDMLGSTEEDPLREMNAREVASSSAKDTDDDSPSLRAMTPKRKKETKSKPKQTTHLAERENKPVLTQVVIPAAFPKFPPKEEIATPATEPELKTEVAQESVREKLKREMPKPAPEVTEQLEVTEPKVSQDAPAKDSLITPPKPRVDTVPTAPAVEEEMRDAPLGDASEDHDTKVQVEAVEEVIQEPEIKEPEAWLDNGRPPWAQDRFECLLFSVAGLKLAVPLISLGAIYQIEKEFTPLVGRADWFMGLYRTQDRNIQVVDTAKWVMPDRYHEGVRDGYKFIIRLGGNNWGMACDSVHEAIQLNPEQVKWRSERSKRPWLSGTVVDHMCALLDADMLGYLLQKDARVH